MKANVITGPGPAREVFLMTDMPVPQAGDYDVVVKVLYTSVNPLDCRIRLQPAGNRTFPVTLGFDVCGEVTACGSLVKDLSEGDIVMASPNPFRAGANAEYVVVDARSCHPVQELDLLQAGALPLAGITAWEALFDRLKVNAGDQVLIHAGAGGVGHIAIQLAVEKGCHVITTASRDESILFCKELGAHKVINYKTESIKEVVMEMTQGKGLNYILDTAGGNTFLESLTCLHSGGHICTILPVSFDPVTGYANLLQNRTISYEFMGASLLSGNPGKQKQVLSELLKSVAARKLQIRIAGVESLDNLASVHEKVETGHTTGKWVVRVGG